MAHPGSVLASAILSDDEAASQAYDQVPVPAFLDREKGVHRTLPLDELDFEGASEQYLCAGESIYLTKCT